MSLLTGLVSYWKCDEASGNLLDAHGSNDLTDINTVGSATGKINNGRDFDRDNHEYFTRSSGIFSSLPLATSGWFKMESTGINHNIISGGIGGGHAYAYGISVTPSNKLSAYISDGGGTFVSVTGTTTLSSGVWYHFAFNWRSTTNYEIYLNATSEGTGSTPRPLGGAINVFGIGIYRPTTGDHWDGIIDEIGIWNRELTGAEITELYNSGNGLAYPFTNQKLPAIHNYYRRLRG